MNSARYALREIVHMMRVGRHWWLTPLIIIFVVFALVALLTEGAALMPLIYTLF